MSNDAECQSSAEPSIHDAQATGCGHVIVREDYTDCFVVADLTKDWRFKNNPIYSHGKWKVSLSALSSTDVQFYAAAPLNYQRAKGQSVSFGTLCLYDKDARDTFSKRDQDILLKLADMLVYQLATLVSLRRSASR